MVYASMTKPMKQWQIFLLALGSSALMFIILIPTMIDGDTSVGTAVSGSLFISAVLFCTIMFGPFMKRKVNVTLDDLAAKNSNTLKVGTRPIIEKSIIWQSIAQAGTETNTQQLEHSMILETNCIERKDGNPRFSIGRIWLNGTYQNFGYFVVTLPQKFAHIFIDADSSNHNFTGSNFRYRLNQDERYDLEGSFHDFFDVYAGDPNIARAATYILTPDVMEKIVTYSPISDIEIIDDKLIFIWQDSALSGREIDWANFLPRALYLLNEVGGSIYERIGKYRFDGGSFDSAAVSPASAYVTKPVSYSKGQAILEPTTPLVYAAANTGRAIARNPVIIWKTIGWAALGLMGLILIILIVILSVGGVENYQKIL